VLTITAANASRSYGTANPTFAASYSGWVGGDTSAALIGTPNLATTAISASAAGAYPITATTGTLAAANYTFKFVSGTLTVTKATPSITLASSANASVYGARVSFTATVSSGGPAGTVIFYDGAVSIGSSNLSGTTATFAIASLKAGSHSITASLGGANYNPVTSAAITQTVNKAILTVTANNSVTYGTASLVLSPSYSGWVNGDTAAVLTGIPALSTPAKATSPVGVYAITATAGTLTTANYTFQYVSGNLVIVKAVLTVTANNASRVYGTMNPTFAAAYSGWVNGDTAAVLTGTPALTTKATTASAVGAYPITAAVGTLATANYTFKLVPGTLTVTR
jgi:hypothetical protein